MALFAAILHVLLALVLAPLLPGIINRTKALVAGRRGQPLLQTYYDLAKLLRKGAVYSHTTTWIFRMGPIVALGSLLTVLPMIPLGGVPAVAAFPGDLLLAAYLLGLARFATVVAALDTGSSFEGMGASREVQFSALAEPALILGLAAMAVQAAQHVGAPSFSLTAIFAAVRPDLLPQSAPALLLVAAALAADFLAENARIPVDDPNTHLELTMIHEVMVLDHGGPDFALIQYGAALKLWILGALIVGILVPVRSAWPLLDLAAGLAGMGLLAVFTGAVESGTARLKLVRVPQFLVAASVLSILALVLVLR